LKQQHLPCPCGKSSDGYTEYPTGGYCFSCTKKFWNNKEEEILDEKAYTLQQLPYRGHSLSAVQKYNVKLKVSEATGDPIGVVYPVYHDGESEKHRDLVKKSFYWVNNKGPGLGGKHLFGAGSAQAVTITEGEEDMLSAYEMLGSKYPVVTVQSAGQAKADCAADKDFLDSFEKIYLCFDNDDAGRRAEASVSSLFPYSKIYIVRKSKFKDANEYQLNNAEAEYRKVWWAAKRHDPENIMSSFTDIGEVFKQPKKKAICDFPFSGLQDATFGIRTGETYLFKALEGIGKTELMGAIEYHVAKSTDLPIGIIHLEEDLQRSAIRLVGYEVGQPVHIEGFSDYSPEDLLSIYKSVAKNDNRIHFYQKGKNDTDVDAFLNSIRFMVAQAGCKIVFFDHISRVATSFNLDTSGLDNFATRLSELAIELDFALIMITHVNDDGLTRGSRNISKEAWTVVMLTRDKVNPDPVVRNTTHLLVEKNRHASITGPAGEVYFDINTFKLSDDRPAFLPEVG
jgi:twinkle protein